MALHCSAQFRRSGQRDDRRRLLLCDPASGGESRRRARRRRVVRKSENYGDAEFMDEQARLTDLIPRRLWVYALALLLGLGVIAGLEYLYYWMPRLAPATTDGVVEAFDLDGEGTLCVWFSSTTLTLAAFVALLVFSVRRHRRDDYHGMYRIWLWAAACWLLMSLDETASLHEGFKEMMVLATGRRLGGDGSLWWAVPYFFLLGGVGVRLLIDMRECRLSSAAFLLAGTSFAVAVAAQLGWVLPESGARGIMVEEGAEMLGFWMVLLAMSLHARHVILDAEGLLPPRAEPAEGSQTATTPSTRLSAASQAGHEEVESAPRGLDDEDAALDRHVTVHPPHGVPRPAAMSRPAAPVRTALASSVSKTTKRRAKPPASVSQPAEEDEAPPLHAPTNRKLTKAEKKALRRRLEKMRREREKRAG